MNIIKVVSIIFFTFIITGLSASIKVDPKTKQWYFSRLSEQLNDNIEERTAIYLPVYVRIKSSVFRVASSSLAFSTFAEPTLKFLYFFSARVMNNINIPSDVPEHVYDNKEETVFRRERWWWRLRIWVANKKAEREIPTSNIYCMPREELQKTRRKKKV